MPELPEVEVVRRGLATHLVGREIREVEVFHPRTLRDYPVAAFSGFLIGWTPTAAVRRGKFLWLLGETRREAEPLALVIHLGMSGQCLVNPPGTELSTAALRHLRARLCFVDGWSLNFVDQRTFGRLLLDPLVPTTDQQPGGLGSAERLVPQLVQARIARDALDPALDLKRVAKQIRTRKTAIKNVLLDQTVVSGIGNIYADEALFMGRINPLSPPGRLRLDQIAKIYGCARQVMQRALQQGGTSFDALYVNTDGDPGYFARSLQVYGRKDQPCLVCERRLQQLKIAGRSATFCPSCQPLSQS